MHEPRSVDAEFARQSILQLRFAIRAVLRQATVCVPQAAGQGGVAAWAVSASIAPSPVRLHSSFLVDFMRSPLNAPGSNWHTASLGAQPMILRHPPSRRVTGLSGHRRRNADTRIVAMRPPTNRGPLLSRRGYLTLSTYGLICCSDSGMAARDVLGRHYATGLGHDEMPEQNAPRLGLHGLRMDGQQVLAEQALLLVTDHVGLQHLLAALRAHHHERRGGASRGRSRWASEEVIAG